MKVKVTQQTQKNARTDKIEEDSNGSQLRFLKLVSLNVFQSFLFVTFEIMLERRLLYKHQ